MDSGGLNEKFIVGGVELDRPFRIRRLGHFGYYANDMKAALHFYRDLLGFNISDVIDFGRRAPDPKKLEGLGDSQGYFLRHGTDHHSFVIFPYRVRKALDQKNALRDNVTSNQITWQLGSIREVVNSWPWLQAHGCEPYRAGRDTPGSNWHTYVYDPDGQIIELYYGIEQIGWNGKSKTREIHLRQFDEPPELPYRSEFQEIEDALAEGIDIDSGYRAQDVTPQTFDVGGILLSRPFKVTAVGPIRNFCKDVEATRAYFQEIFGFHLTEKVTYRGHDCYFLRVNTEHHSLALYPLALRAELGLSDHSNSMSFGVRVNDYDQLKKAITFLEDHEVEIRYLPPELFPGMDYTAFAIDPDGHAVQLYYYMEQIGWDGRPRPASDRPKIDNANWPETVPVRGDTFMGEVFLGPLG